MNQKRRSYVMPEIKHGYGKNFHISSSTHLLTLMAKLGHPQTEGFQVCYLTRVMYQILLHYALSQSFPSKEAKVMTRMTEGVKDKQAQKMYEGPIFDEKMRVVVVDIARAGILPAQSCYEELSALLVPGCVRQDHFYLSRVKRNGKIEIDCAGSKIGGDVENSLVIIPDPMGATGETVRYCLDYYKKHSSTKGVKFLMLHLVITPEYIRNLKKEKCDYEVFTARVDRGMSAKKIRDLFPGESLDKEFALNDDYYIVPGAGGLGEVLNNSFV